MKKTRQNPDAPALDHPSTAPKVRPVGPALDQAVPSDLAFARSPLGQRLRALLADEQVSTGNRAIADFLLRNPVRATAWGIEELAANAGTSTATLSRFARVLGLNGFAALRLAMAEELQAVLHPVEKLRGLMQAHEGPQAGQSAVGDSLQSALAQVRDTVLGLDGVRLAALARRLTGPGTVYVMGFGLSAHLAAMLALHLQAFCPRLVNVVEFGGSEVAAGRLMNVGAGDVLVTLSFPRYSADAIRLTRYARERGATTVAITDSLASPLAAAAEETLVASAQHTVLSSSGVSALLVVEALVATLMLSNSKHVDQAGRLTEAISGYLYTPESGASARKKRAG